MRPVKLRIGRKVYRGHMLETRLSSESILAYKAIGYSIHSIRHSDTDWDSPATLERHVCVNFFGVFVHNNPEIDELLNAKDFLTITSWEYTD